jgi:LytS/YehU family sensor histidine kinase
LSAVIIVDYIFSSYFEFRIRIKGKLPPISFFSSIFIIALSTSIKLAQKWFENESKQKEMIHEKMNSELSLLKSQVNPHFLFNTLNGIYSLANAKSEKTAPAIVKLSQLMRYMLDESKQQFVSLSSELDYINTFIDLQRLRLFDNVKVEFNIEGEAENIKIQPLLLIPFVENAFKHGTDSTSDCLINIDLQIKDKSIYLIVKNDDLKSRDEDGKSGFGLNNIKRRLELEYPQRHVLNTEVIDNVFIVKLFISLV